VFSIQLNNCPPYLKVVESNITRDFMAQRSLFTFNGHNY